MDFLFDPISEEYADAIVSWKESDGYACYDAEGNETELDDMLLSGEFDFFIVKTDSGELLGFVECTFDENDIMEIGCALVPEFMGQGLGCEFISACMEFVQEHYDYGKETIKTLLKPGDVHAIKVYERVGFSVVDESDEWVELDIEL